jgi:hypothetical protein
MSILKKTALAAACVGTLLFAGAASAAGMGSLQIKGTVAGTCEFHTPTTAYVMDFGPLDTSATSPATAVADLTYHCTTGTPAARLFIDGVIGGNPSGNSGETLNMNSGANRIPVTLTWTVPTTPGTGFATAPLHMNVNGSISVANLNAAVAGTYTATYPMLILP